MTRPLITDAEFVLSDGQSRLVIERDPNGRIRIGVFDRRTQDGLSMSASESDAELIAAFIKCG